jgi:hypothetical protein
MDPDQPAHPRSLIRIHAVRLPTLLQVEKLIANNMDPDQTAQILKCDQFDLIKSLIFYISLND